jgi:hypothetical protein
VSNIIKDSEEAKIRLYEEGIKRDQLLKYLQDKKVVTVSTPEGVKFDSDKIRVDLLPAVALEEIAKVLTFGAKKYSAWNWSKGLSYSRLLGASLRHLLAFMRGEDKDPESGLSHIAHAGCCILFLLWHEKYKKELDDRCKDPDLLNN